MRCLLLFAMVFPLLMVSCSRGGKELAAKLHLADSLIEAEPDSGAALLMSLEEEAADASRANRYRYQLLLAKAMNKTYRPITTDSVMRKVADYYDDHGSANDRMEAHYLLGCAYRDMGDLPQALLEYETAISLSFPWRKSRPTGGLPAVPFPPRRTIIPNRSLEFELIEAIPQSLSNAKRLPSFGSVTPKLWQCDSQALGA